MTRTTTRTALVVAAVLLPLMTGCGPSVPPGFGDVSDGGVYVTGTTDGSCTYDSNEHGVTFDFTLIGRKDAAIEMEVHRARPGKRRPGDDPGPIIAERIVRVYRGEIPDHIHAVVKLSRDRYDRRLTGCVINVTNYGPNIEMLFDLVSDTAFGASLTVALLRLFGGILIHVISRATSTGTRLCVATP